MVGYECRESDIPSYSGFEIEPSRPIPPTFEERVRYVREKRGFSQSELAQRAGLPQSTISLFESGDRKPSFENLRKLADALSVSVDYLLGRVEDLDGTAGTASAIFRDFNRLDAQGKKVLQDLLKTLTKPPTK